MMLHQLKKIAKITITRITLSGIAMGGPALYLDWDQSWDMCKTFEKFWGRGSQYLRLRRMKKMSLDMKIVSSLEFLTEKESSRYFYLQ